MYWGSGEERKIVWGHFDPSGSSRVKNISMQWPEMYMAQRLELHPIQVVFLNICLSRGTDAIIKEKLLFKFLFYGYIYFLGNWKRQRCDPIMWKNCSSVFHMQLVQVLADV